MQAGRSETDSYNGSVIVAKLEIDMCISARVPCGWSIGLAAKQRVMISIACFTEYIFSNFQEQAACILSVKKSDKMCRDHFLPSGIGQDSDERTKIGLEKIQGR